jgi:hypothetical protein
MPSDMPLSLKLAVNFQASEKLCLPRTRPLSSSSRASAYTLPILLLNGEGLVTAVSGQFARPHASALPVASNCFRKSFTLFSTARDQPDSTGTSAALNFADMVFLLKSWVPAISSILFS